MNKVISMSDRKIQAGGTEIKRSFDAFKSEAEGKRRIYAARGCANRLASR